MPRWILLGRCEGRIKFGVFERSRNHWENFVKTESRHVCRTEAERRISAAIQNSVDKAVIFIHFNLLDPVDKLWITCLTCR